MEGRRGRGRKGAGGRVRVKLSLKGEELMRRVEVKALGGL